MLRRRSDDPDDQTRIEILTGLIQLRKDGHFHAIDAGNCIRIQFEACGPWKHIGWRRAAEMVETARQALAAALQGDQAPQRKPPAPESARRAEYLRETGRK